MKRYLVSFFVVIALLGATEARGESGADLDECEKVIEAKSLLKALRHFVKRVGEIPEEDSDLISGVAAELKVQPAEIKAMVHPGGLFGSAGIMLQAAREAKPESFVKVIDRRVFTAERNRKLIDAIRDSQNLIIFKAVEGQKIGDFETVSKLANELKAPIIIVPAFGDLGTLPTSENDFLFNDPRVHFFVEQRLQITTDIWLYNNGGMDKLVTPLTGIDQLFDPTDTVIVPSPTVNTITRASGTYDIQNGRLLTSGSMSIPAYRGRFGVGMTTDARAQITAEQNRGLMVLSRKVNNKLVNNLTEGANAMIPRRVHFTPEYYGNPAGLFDMGKIYGAAGVTRLTAIPGLIFPDIHIGATDPGFQKAATELMLKMGILKKNSRAGQPGELEYVAGPVTVGTMVFHDLVDGTPYNGHTMERLFTQMQLDKEEKFNVRDHYSAAAQYMNLMTMLFPNTTMVIPVDNHGYDWIKKALENPDLNATQLRPAEMEVHLRLMLDALNSGANPYEALLRYYGLNTEHVRFVNPEDTYRIGVDLKNPDRFSLLQGVEVGQHSHSGISGAKSISIKGLLGAYGSFIGGHTHSSSESGQSKRVGTGTSIRQSYHRGPSRSDTSIALVYSPEAVQLLYLARGTFVPDAPDQPADLFFPPGLPRIIAWPTATTTTDQYRDNPPMDRHAF